MKEIDIIKELLFWFFGISVLVIAFLALRSHKNKNSKKITLSHLQSFSVWTFFAGFVFFIPICYAIFDFQFELKILRPCFLAALMSVKAFILDTDYETVTMALSGCSRVLKVFYTTVGIAFFTVAPLLTAGFILSLFKNFTEEHKFRRIKNKPIYIMSELNDKSLTLAKSIRKESENKGLDAAIVFAGVSRDCEQENAGIKSETDEIKSICLEKDIADIDLMQKNGKVEIFLISEDESLNIENTIKLNDKLNKRPETHIFVYASSPQSASIIDSLNKGNIALSEELKEKLVKSSPLQEKILSEGFDGIGDIGVSPLESSFEITRIDSVNSFVLNTFMNSGIFELSKVASAQEKVISIMIIGMGQYGKQILKTSLWFCQMDGYKLEINVVDSGIKKNGKKVDIRDVLKHECPEMITKNPSLSDGDANYTVNFYTDVDCFTSKFDELFENKDSAENLKKTQVVFVSLGDDDKNIAAALSVRKNFDRLGGISDTEMAELKDNEEKDIPVIYAIVHDDKKTENLKNVNQLINYKEMPFHIRFIGNLSEQYSYNTIVNSKKLERNAFFFHINWAKVEMEMEDDLRKVQNSEILSKVLQEEQKGNIEELEWNYKYMYDESGSAAKSLLSDMEKYTRFEYFRLSSVAKAVHKEMIFKAFPEEISCKKYGNFLCECENCERRRKSEHMRWIAYMRVNGYIWGEQRADRGQVHPKLCNWNNLYTRDKFKD